MLARYRIACPTITGAGTGSFEFEAASGLYPDLQCGSYIFMNADYRHNRGRDGGPFATFEPSLFVWATVMSRPAEDRAIVDNRLKALAFDSGPPLVCDEPAAPYERTSDEHGRLALSAATNRLGDKIRLIPATATRPSTFTTGTSASATTTSSSSGGSPPAVPFIDTPAWPNPAVALLRVLFSLSLQQICSQGPRMLRRQVNCLGVEHVCDRMSDIVGGRSGREVMPDLPMRRLQQSLQSSVGPGLRIGCSSRIAKCRTHTRSDQGARCSPRTFCSA